jgi:hypothetical protein
MRQRALMLTAASHGRSKLRERTQATNVPMARPYLPAMLDAMKGRNVQHPLHVRHIQRNYRSDTTRLLALMP